MHEGSSAAFGSHFIAARPHPRPAAPEERYEVETRTGAEMLPDLAAWRALAAWALEPSLISHPDFFLPALRHLADGRSVTLMLVWRHGAAGRRLGGVFPVVLPRTVLGLNEVTLWQPASVALATPLVDRDMPVEIIEAALRALEARRSRCAGLLLPQLAAGGPTAEILVDTARRNGHRLDQFVRGSGVWLLPAREDEIAGLQREGSAKPQGLGGKAGFQIEHARTARDVRDAVERFLVLDALSANARRRAPLVQDPGATSFLRTATRQFAHRSRCRVDVVRVEGKPVLAAIVLGTPGAAWLWRVAALPEGEHLRDGLLTTIMARAQRRREALYVFDGVAVDDERAPRLGLKSLPVTDMLVSIQARRSPRGAAVHLKGHLDRRVRGIAGEGYRRVRNLMPRPVAAAG
jgi:hypothetical protein